MKLVVQGFLTLDGVSQGPGSPDEDPSDGFEIHTYETAGLPQFGTYGADA